MTEIAGLKAKLNVMTDDERISYIQYDYYNGTHEPSNLKQSYTNFTLSDTFMGT